MIQNQTTTTKAKGSKLKPLKICDRALLVLTLLILASSLQLEITAGATPLWVWLHMALGTLFLLLILRHLYLHFRWTNWWTRLVASRPTRRPLRWLTITGLLLLLSAIVAALHWLAAPVHSFPGALHGKIGFLFLILLIPHILRHRRFYLPRKPARKHPADTRLPNPSPLRPLSPAPLSDRGEA